MFNRSKLKVYSISDSSSHLISFSSSSSLISGRRLLFSVNSSTDRVPLQRASSNFFCSFGKLLDFLGQLFIFTLLLIAHLALVLKVGITLGCAGTIIGSRIVIACAFSRSCSFSLLHPSPATCSNHDTGYSCQGNPEFRLRP